MLPPIGAVLPQWMDDYSEKPFPFISRTLSPAEKKYFQLEKEALAIVFAVKQFHQYLFGNPFTLYSDHQLLKHLHCEFCQIPVILQDTMTSFNIVSILVHHST